MRQDNQRKVAVILSGGGARGAYHIGVLKALRRRGIHPDIYSGTSVGAFNACLLASGKTLDEAEQIWTQLRERDIFRVRFDPRRLFTLNPEIPLQMAMESTGLLLDFLGNSARTGLQWWNAVDLDSMLLDTTPLQRLIERNVDLDRLKASPHEVFVTLTRLRPTHGGLILSVGRSAITHAHIYASCALPLIFSGVSIEEGFFCDGGLVANTPLRSAIDHGAEEIYIVNLTPPPPDFRNATLPLAFQALSTVFSAALNRDIAVALDRNAEYLAALIRGGLVNGKLEVPKVNPDLTEKTARYAYVNIFEIEPTLDLGGIESFLNFTPERARRLIEDGESDTDRILSGYHEEDVGGPDGTRLRIWRRSAAPSAP